MKKPRDRNHFYLYAVVVKGKAGKLKVDLDKVRYIHKVMTDTQFNAILAKNDIMREVKQALKHKVPVNIQVISFALEEIEAYIGQANQPSVNEILENKRNDI